MLQYFKPKRCWQKNLNKFCGIIRRLLDNEFKPHPAYPTTLHRLNQCVELFQEYCTSEMSYAQSTVVHLQKLFACLDIDHLKLVASYKPICNVRFSLQDLKKCLMHLTKNLPPYFPPDEYLTADDFANYKDQERAELSQVIATTSLHDPGLVSCYIESNAFSPEDYIDKPFVIIPKNPRNIYRALTIVITQNNLVETDDTSAPSDASLALLKECALRWRLGSTFMLIADLEATACFFGKGDLAFDALVERLFEIQKYIKQHPCERWAASDRQYLASIFSYLLPMLFDTFCAKLGDMSHFPISLDHQLLDTVDYMLHSFVVKEKGVDLAVYADEFSGKIQGVFIQRYEHLHKSVTGASEALNLHHMAKLIMKDINYAAQLFKAPLLGLIDATAILVEFELKYFTLQAKSMLNGRESELIPAEDAFDFYNAFAQLHDLARNYVPDLQVGINLEHWFNRQFVRWLAALDNKSLRWVELAIQYDNFEPVSDSALHSSSVDDLIRCFREQLDLFDKLSWPNDLLESRSMARVAKVIYESIELYANRLVELSQKTNQPPPSSSPKPKWEPKWDVLKIGHKKKHVKDITKEQCIFVNNIYYLRKRTLELFQNVDCQRYSKVLVEYSKGKQDNTPQARMFYIKIVTAELLKECDSGKDNDAYAILSMGDKDLLTTSIQWDDAQPKWNETCGVVLDSAQDISVRIFDKDLLTDDLCGEGILNLDPQDYWSSEDTNIWLDLEPQGRVLFIISTANEKDDPHYYISKAISTLEMHEMGLLQSLLSKLTSTIKSSLSRKTVLHAISKGRDGHFHKFLGSSHMPSELKFSDEDCDQALVGLVDLLDARLNLPFRVLYEPCGYRLVTAIWSECLVAIESAMVPPFSKKRSTPKPLTKLEVDFLLRIVELLKIFFHGGDDGDGLPTQMLEIPNSDA
ncbi:hypothetical protein DSO57_1033643 [Entomophthora muscae]|uniref:Uncharacterized protein n=1 Tax=Entomophthora muscae TaxID=34485 RepID=A0ACC2UKW1_9FUNG|nr:hypothetical protein DSO57_1033643 [Entomophthora muscae]